jgi:hypothetical protein
MNTLKKQFIKSVIKLTIVENKPNLLKTHIAKLSELDKKFKTHDRYIIEAFKLLNGVENINVSYEEGILTIHYNEQIVTAQKVYSWMRVILDVALDNLEFIERYNETNAEYIIQRLGEVLKRKVQLFNK